MGDDGAQHERDDHSRRLTTVGAVPLARRLWLHMLRSRSSWHSGQAHPRRRRPSCRRSDH